jgi:hypothetical protein
MKRKWLTAIQKKKQAEDDAAAAATSKKKKVTPAQLRAQKGMYFSAVPSAYAHTNLGTQIWRSSPSAQQ